MDFIDGLMIRAVNIKESNDILDDVVTPIYKRNGYKLSNNVLTIPIYFARFIGVSEDEDNYYERIYEIHRKLNTLNEKYLFFDKCITREIPDLIKEQFELVWNKVSLSQYMDTTELFKTIKSYGLLPKEDNTLCRYMDDFLKIVLDYYLRQSNSFNLYEVKDIITYNVYWCNLYLYELLKVYDIKDVNPKILFYGRASIEEAFFMIVASLLGVDVLYFNTEGNCILDELDKYEAFSTKMLFERFSPLRSSLGDSGRFKTSTYNAQEEVDEILFNGQTNMYKPWQLVDYSVAKKTLKTTYDEIFVWTMHESLLREGFKVTKNTVYIPNLFSKVNGVEKNEKDYFDKINNIVSMENTLLYTELPIITSVPLEYGKYRSVINYDGYIDADKIISSSWWPFKDMRISIQKGIVEKINELINEDKIISESDTFEDKAVDILSTVLKLNVDMKRLLQGFDYSKQVPKIVIFNNGSSSLSYEDSIILAFMNAMGIDIVVYNPAGYNDIEIYLKKELYDVHHLDRIMFDLKYKKSIKKGLFDIFKKK